MNLRAILLSPFALINSIVLRLRHFCFDMKILASEKVDHKIIIVGNLAFGGTGKTPFTEYLIRLLNDKYNIGVVSRGYGRKDSKLKEVKLEDASSDVGDEPLQMKKKFPEIPFFVFPQRVIAIYALMKNYPNNDLVILDDALQHRKLKNGFRILLTTAQRPFTSDLLFPSGYLRDIRSRAYNADIIIVTKTTRSNVLNEKIKTSLAKYKKPIFFSKLHYNNPVHINSGEILPRIKFKNGLLVTGIASAQLLKDHLKEKATNWRHLSFRDHHEYDQKDFEKIRELFDSFSGTSVIFTTEKDAIRIKSNKSFNTIMNMPIYVVGVQMKLIADESEFKKLIEDYVGKNKGDS